MEKLDAADRLLSAPTSFWDSFITQSPQAASDLFRRFYSFHPDQQCSALLERDEPSGSRDPRTLADPSVPRPSFAAERKHRCIRIRALALGSSRLIATGGQGAAALAPWRGATEEFLSRPGNVAQHVLGDTASPSDAAVLAAASGALQRPALLDESAAAADALLRRYTPGPPTPSVAQDDHATATPRIHTPPGVLLRYVYWASGVRLASTLRDAAAVPPYGVVGPGGDTFGAVATHAVRPTILAALMDGVARCVRCAAALSAARSPSAGPTSHLAVGAARLLTADDDAAPLHAARALLVLRSSGYDVDADIPIGGASPGGLGALGVPSGVSVSDVMVAAALSLGRAAPPSEFPTAATAGGVAPPLPSGPYGFNALRVYAPGSASGVLSAGHPGAFTRGAYPHSDLASDNRPPPRDVADAFGSVGAYAAATAAAMGGHPAAFFGAADALRWSAACRDVAGPTAARWAVAAVAADALQAAVCRAQRIPQPRQWPDAAASAATLAAPAAPRGAADAAALAAVADALAPAPLAATARRGPAGVGASAHVRVGAMAVDDGSDGVVAVAAGRGAEAPRAAPAPPLAVQLHTPVCAATLTALGAVAAVVAAPAASPRGRAVEAYIGGTAPAVGAAAAPIDGAARTTHQLLLAAVAVCAAALPWAAAVGAAAAAAAKAARIAAAAAAASAGGAGATATTIGGIDAAAAANDYAGFVPPHPTASGVLAAAASLPFAVAAAAARIVARNASADLRGSAAAAWVGVAGEALHRATATAVAATFPTLSPPALWTLASLAAVSAHGAGGDARAHAAPLVYAAAARVALGDHRGANAVLPPHAAPACVGVDGSAAWRETSGPPHPVPAAYVAVLRAVARIADVPQLPAADFFGTSPPTPPPLTFRPFSDVLTTDRGATATGAVRAGADRTADYVWHPVLRCSRGRITNTPRAAQTAVSLNGLMRAPRRAAQPILSAQPTRSTMGAEPAALRHAPSQQRYAGAHAANGDTADSSPHTPQGGGAHPAGGATGRVGSASHLGSGAASSGAQSSWGAAMARRLQTKR